jgi:hypothetical protein
MFADAWTWLQGRSDTIKVASKHRGTIFPFYDLGLDFASSSPSQWTKVAGHFI